MSKKTEHGTIVSTQWEHEDHVIVLEKEGEPESRQEVGRIVRQGMEAGFQPAPFAAWAARPDILRLIAETLEEVQKGWTE